MQLDDYFDFQAPNDIRLKGTRVGIETILYAHHYRELRPEEIVREFPSVTLEQVYATILYSLHNKEQVNQYMTDWIEYGRQARERQRREHPEWAERVRQMRAEYEARKRPSA
jgi:uncharacterized protein (DUF433 family)